MFIFDGNRIYTVQPSCPTFFILKETGHEISDHYVLKHYRFEKQDMNDSVIVSYLSHFKETGHASSENRVLDSSFSMFRTYTAQKAAS